MKKIITAVLFLTYSGFIFAQGILFETTDADAASYGSIDVADLASKYFLKGVYSNLAFPKNEGWEIVALDGFKYYYQKTDTSDYGKIGIYDSSSNTATDYGYLSTIFEDPENWMLSGVDAGILYFKSDAINSQIVTYDGNTINEFGYLEDFLGIPEHWTMKGAHDGKIYMQRIYEKSNLENDIKSWDGEDTVLIYKTTDFYKSLADANMVGVSQTNLLPEFISTYSTYKNTHYTRGEYLRVFKLAVAVTGKATASLGGLETTKEQLNNWIAELNELYGRELSLRFELVANNDKLIFENGETDPWPDLLSETDTCIRTSTIRAVQKEAINAILGEENYDMSHIIYNRQGGGCAGIGNLLNGATGKFTNAGRHEIGHQLGQKHTDGYSSSSTLNYEQGGGWTTQAGNKNPYLHCTSYHISANYLAEKFANIGQKIPTGNTIPTIKLSPNYTIPKSTPFVITAAAEDPDSDNTLTYVWDCMNPWYPHSIPREEDTEGGLFKRFFPSEENYRYFPKIEDIIANNNSTEDEQLPTQPRTMDFRVTVNDNNTIVYNNQTVPASGINSDDITIMVADAGPFVVTSQNTTGIAYDSGISQEVTWQVNNTNKAPINATSVKISLSLDGGYTYPLVLNENTPNDGEEMITIPAVDTERARIKVEAVGNIFFDINTTDFSISRSCNTTTHNASNTLEAESYCEMSGIEIENNTTVGFIHNGDYIRFNRVDFSEKVFKKISITASSKTAGGTVEIRKGSDTGELLGTVVITGTGNWGNYQVFTNEIEQLSGTYDLYFVFKGVEGYLFNVDFIKFSEGNITLSTENQIIADLAADITVYPIPAQNELFLKHNQTVRCSKVQMYTISGALVQEIELAPGTNVHSIAIDSLENGIYFMRIHHDYGTTAKEFVVQK